MVTTGCGVTGAHSMGRSDSPFRSVGCSWDSHSASGSGGSSMSKSVTAPLGGKLRRESCPVREKSLPATEVTPKA